MAWKSCRSIETGASQGKELDVRGLMPSWRMHVGKLSRPILIAAFDRIEGGQPVISSKWLTNSIALGIEFVSAQRGNRQFLSDGTFLHDPYRLHCRGRKECMLRGTESGPACGGRSLRESDSDGHRCKSIEHLLLRDRERGLSLNQLAKAHGISKASVCRVLKEEREAVSRGFTPGVLPECSR